MPSAPTKKAAGGPGYYDLIKEAVLMLKERTGSSRHAIDKYVAAKKGASYSKSRLNIALKRGVEAGKLVPVKGSFKLAADEKKEIKKPSVKLSAKKTTSPKAVKQSSTKSTKKPVSKKTASKPTKKSSGKKKTKTAKKISKVSKSSKKASTKKPKTTKKKVVKKSTSKKNATK